MMMMMISLHVHHLRYLWTRSISLIVSSNISLLTLSMYRTISISFISLYLQATATNVTTAECVLKDQASSSRANVPMDGAVASAASTSMNARVRRVSTVEFVSTKLQAMRVRAQKSTPVRTARRT